MRYWQSVFAAFCCVLASGCSLTFPARLQKTPLGTLSKMEFAQCDDDAPDQRASLVYDVKKARSSGSWNATSFLYRSRDTGVPKNDIIRGEFILQKCPRVHTSLVIFLPGTGEDVSTKESAEVLADAGFDVLRFRSGIAMFDKKKLEQCNVITEDDLRAFVREGACVISQRARDYFAVIKYFDQRFNYKTMGVSGVSLGGVFTPILVGSHPKVQSGLIMISGANIAGILRFSKESEIVEIRELIMKKFVGGEPAIWKILEEELASIDPLRFAPSLDPSRTLIIANYWDAVVPFSYAQELWKAAGRPDFEIIIFPPGHYGSALLLWVPMVRYGFKCLVKPICFPIPWSIARVPEINLQFFKQTLPR